MGSKYFTTLKPSYWVTKIVYMKFSSFVDVVYSLLFFNSFTKYGLVYLASSHTPSIRAFDTVRFPEPE